MRVFLALLLTVVMSMTSTYCFAQSKEELAGKIVQADKDVRAYQDAKASGTYVDYSVTPTWVSVFWSLFGLGVVGVVAWVWTGVKDQPGEDHSRKELTETTTVLRKLNALINSNEIQHMRMAEIVSSVGGSQREVMFLLGRKKTSCLDYKLDQFGKLVAADNKIHTDTIEKTPVAAKKKRPSKAKKAPKDSNLSDEDAQKMMELKIEFNGTHFVFQQYKYEKLADAINYARKQA